MTVGGGVPDGVRSRKRLKTVALAKMSAAGAVSVNSRAPQRPKRGAASVLELSA